MTRRTREQTAETRGTAAPGVEVKNDYGGTEYNMRDKLEFSLTEHNAGLLSTRPIHCILSVTAIGCG